jgi:hypothetical protein
MNTTQKKYLTALLHFFYTHKASFLLEQKYLLLLILRQAALISFSKSFKFQPNEQNSTLLLILNCTYSTKKCY